MKEKKALLVLKNEFERRKRDNPNYSLRSFARNLSISPTILSQILNEKKALTPQLLQRIAPSLNLDEEALANFLDETNNDKKNRSVRHLNKNSMRVLEKEAFAIISEWHHYAILEMLNLDYFENDPKWIARKLGIDVRTARSAIENLKKIGLITSDGNGNLTSTDNFTTINDYPYSSKAMKKRQKELLQLSSEKIEQIDISLRDHSAITFSIDLSLIPEVKEKIKTFRRQLGNFIAKKSNETHAVYELQIGLFPLTEIDKE